MPSATVVLAAVCVTCAVGSALGGRLRGVENAGLAGEQDGHCIIIIEKTAQTAKIYPRKYAKITKNPL